MEGFFNDQNYFIIKRIAIFSVLIFCSLALIFWSEKEFLLKFLLDHALRISETKIIFNAYSLSEIFLSYVKVCLFLSLYASFHVFLCSLWFFIRPALYVRERRVLLFLLLSSVILGNTGVYVSLAYIVPLCIGFFADYSSLYVEVRPSLDSVLSLILKSSVVGGLVFNFPIFIFALVRFGLISLSDLCALRKFVYIIILVLSGIITPPDPLSLFIVAVPLIVLYEISLVLLRCYEVRNA